MPKGDGGGAGRAAADAIKQGNQQAIAELRRQFGITQENIEPFLETGRGALSGLLDATSISGLDERFKQLQGSDAFKTLTGERERAIRGQLSAGGLTRSGTGIGAIADVPTQVLLGLENQQFGRQFNLATGGQNAALGLSSLGQQNASSIAGLFQSSGQAQSQGILADQQARAASRQGTLNTIGSLGLAAAIAFSDPDLKQNIERVSEIQIDRNISLPIYQWDWIDEAQTTAASKCPTIGFLSTDVKKLYPDLVSKSCGFDVIFYDVLFDVLEKHNEDQWQEDDFETLEAELMEA